MLPCTADKMSQLQIQEEQEQLIAHSTECSATKSPSSAKSRPYSPLDPEENNIRVLDLFPGRSDERLSGVLRVVSLDTKPLYEAVSYTWGRSSEDKSIRINKSYNVKVTDNLFVALKRFRGQFAKRTLWIDSICIDQLNVHEREHQVSKMGVIYKLSTTVLIWLGEYPNPSSVDQWQMRRPHWKRKGNTLMLNSRGRKFSTALDCAIRNTQPRWLDRAWVVQEFVLAQEKLLCFGPISMAYDVVHIIDLLTLSPQPLPYLRAFHERTSDMAQLKYGLGDKRQSICEAALYTSTASCSESHDKVYSLFSLIDETETRLIECKYTRPFAETFARATFASISAQNAFTILELVNCTNRVMEDLPTWAVDFNVAQCPTEGRIHQRIRGAVHWPTCRPAHMRCARVDPTAKLLITKGIEFDRISEVMTMHTTEAFRRGPQAVELAVDLAAFLEAVCRKHRSIDQLQQSCQQPMPQIQSHFFLTGSGETDVHHILGLGCLLWDEVVGDAPRNEGPGYRLFWECDEHERWDRVPRKTPDDLCEFMQYAAFASEGCVLFATVEGFIGWASSTLRADDLIVLVCNSKLPIVLRRLDQYYSFQGFAYVHGIMEDQLLEAWKGRDIHEVEFVVK